MLTFTRQYAFSARHRLHSPALGDARNREVYGQCNNPAGHGHNYRLEITVTGAIHPDTGWICPREVLDRAVGLAIEPNWDHQDLNETLGEDFITTGENLVLAAFCAVQEVLPADVRLCRVKLHETRKNTFVYFGKEGAERLAADLRHPNFL